MTTNKVISRFVTVVDQLTKEPRQCLWKGCRHRFVPTLPFDLCTKCQCLSEAILPVKTNDLKDGTRILLDNGWYGTLRDNRRGNIRYAEVEGYVTEVGSVYSHDIVRAEVGGVWVLVEHTAGQIKCRQLNAGLFGG